MIANILGFVFGDGRNVVAETAQVFRENAEAAGQRDAQHREHALAQFGTEFTTGQTGRFDRIVDGLNRLPRPMLAFGTIGLFVSALHDPIWFASRMQGLALVPEPLWWLMGAIVGFYFGARHQAHGQAFQRSIAQTMAQVPVVAANLRALEAVREVGPAGPAAADTGTDAALAVRLAQPSDNLALDDWLRRAA